MKGVVRRAAITDLDAVAELFDQYRVWYGKPSNPEEANRFLKERFVRDESVIFVIVENEKFAGFAQLYPLFSSIRMKRLWLLNDLFVKEQFRGRGYSKALLECIKQLCAETDACGFTLETEKSNDIGNSLYPAAGMKLNTDFNFYYWDI